MKRILIGTLAGLLIVAGAIAADNFNVLDKLNISFSTATITGQLAPANGGSGVANTKNLTWSNSLTLAGTDATTMTFPATSASIARTDAANTFTGIQSFNTAIALGSGGTGATTNRAAAASLAGPFILCKSAVQVAAPADTSEDILYTCSVPANALVSNGMLRIHANFAFTNNGNSKTLRVRFSGIGGTQVYSQAFTTQTPVLVAGWVANKNATNAQITSSIQVNGAASTGNGVALAAVDTTAGTTVVFTCQKATAGDACTLDHVVVELLSDGT